MPNRLLVALGVMAIVGCSSAPPVKLPTELESIPRRLHVKLETKSQILVVHRLEPNAECEKVKEWSRVRVFGPESGSVTIETSCTIIPKTVVAITKDFLPAGEYDIRIESERSKFAARSWVTLNPLDPEAKSGPDQDFGGAVELAENQSVKGAVSFAEANATNWVQVKTKGGDVALLFLTEAPSDVQARLFLLAKGAKAPRRMGTLTPKTKRHVQVKEGVLYVQITGRKFTAESGYTLTRRDSAVTKSVSLAVIDCYPVNATASVVLLKPTEGIKVNDEVRVSARKGKGSVAIGKCVVTSLSETQVSCRMDAVPASDLSHYRAELVKEEGST